MSGMSARYRPDVATVRRPWVDDEPFVRTVFRHGYIDPIATEVDLVDADTGLVVYTTPKIGNVTRRMSAWLRRHGFGPLTWNASGRYEAIRK